MSKLPLRLTESIIDALPIDGRDRLFFDALAPGFGVRVTPAGAKIFVAQARVDGKPRRVTLGTHPEKTVVDARREARGVLEDMRAGRDPLAERASRKRAVEAGTTTIADFADRWIAEHVATKLKASTGSDYQAIVENRIKPKMGHLTVAQIGKEDVLAWHASMKNIPRRANYAVATLRSMLTYAEDVGLRPPLSNPCRRIKLYREYARERFLSEQEIGKAAEGIATAERDGKIGPHAAAGLRLALFTGARSGEITAIEWTHVDWSRRFIRLPDSKTNDPRTIHLSEAALEVLRGVPRVGRYVIAGANPNEAYQNLSRAWMVARKSAGLEDVRLHDLRHSYASLAAGRGVSLQMIGKLLGHKVPATTQRYAHLARDAVADVNDELGIAMVAAIEKETPTEGAVVVKLRRRTPKVPPANA